MSMHIPSPRVRRTQTADVLHQRPTTPGGWIQYLLIYLILLLLAFTYMLPFIWMVSSALKIDAQVYVAPPIWFPNPAH